MTVIAIGLTGTKRAGKSTAVKILRELGFDVRSTREAVEKYMNENPGIGNPEDTTDLQKVGNQYRLLDDGVDRWMTMLLEEPITQDVVFDAVRYPKQDETLRQYSAQRKIPYKLFAIDASFDLRLRRALESGLVDNENEFRQIDERDMQGYLNGTGQNVRGCLSRAEIIIMNDRTEKEFRESLLFHINNFRESYRR